MSMEFNNVMTEALPYNPVDPNAKHAAAVRCLVHIQSLDDGVSIRMNLAPAIVGGYEAAIDRLLAYTRERLMKIVEDAKAKGMWVEP